jgi:beta-lactamase superfamily II metal-dependent hydrolase
MARTKPDAAAPRYFLLDMGKEKYGDAILCLLGGKTILIDGGHPGDFDGQPGTASLPKQIEDILGASPHIDLLICTHCHLDHIGCLPKMIKNEVLTVGTALVADEKLGWGKKIAAPDAAVLPDSPIAARVVAALREEPRADDFESDADIERFLNDAVTLEVTYKGMLKALEDAGTKVIRYGRNSVTALLKEYAATGLTILGPTKQHLEICRKAIASSMQDAIADTARLMQVDAGQSDVEMYRRLAGAATQDATADGSRLGAALNNQSIIIALGPKTNRVLMTGDMQFSDPAVPGLDAEMTKLRKKVKAAGPYKFAKLAHHGSHNGFDESVRQEWGATKLFAVSGGSNDTGHPAREILKLLKAEAAGVKWARTDKNGRIELKPSSKTKPFTTAKGQLNDSTANKPPHDERERVVPAAVVERTSGSGSIEIVARVPEHLRRVVITIESDGPDRIAIPIPRPAPLSIDNVSLGGGRVLPPLLFASNRKMLGDNIGKAEAQAAIEMIERAGQTYVDMPDPEKAQAAIHKKLTDAHRGVVLIGGYDILPAKRLDTLPAAVRAKLGDAVDDDADSFIVWSDSLYGDKDDDDLPELPVTRIPDGKSSQLVLSALASQGVNLKSDRFSIFNSKRPFATDVIKCVPGLAEALRSLPKTRDSLPMDGVSVPLVYFMLHGYDDDATRFAGQEPEYPDAFDIDQVPGAGSGVVFTGCCWGALTVRQIASRVTSGKGLTLRTPEDSIALRYLRAGYNAYIGCTGSHYSPPGKNMTHGKPMHVAFWKQLVEKHAPPAEALFEAKKQYLKDMPHGMDDVLDVAIEHKILRQFTCLGLGW